MSTVSRAAEIRKALKAHGWTSRDVSVRSDIYSMGSSIDIRIKNADVPSAVVKALASGHESIRYDEYSGEILSGGNRYVSVVYDEVASNVHRDRYLAVVEAAVAKISGSFIIPVEGTPFGVATGSNGWGVSVWGEHSHKAATMNAAEAARWIGAAMVNLSVNKELAA